MVVPGFPTETDRQVSHVEWVRFSVGNYCVCSYEDRSNGWGCCCSQPLAVTQYPEGEFVLTHVGPSEVED